MYDWCKTLEFFFYSQVGQIDVPGYWVVCIQLSDNRHALLTRKQM